MRLDLALVNRGLCDSRERAKRLILAGEVTVNEQRALKASQTVKETDQVVLSEPEKYVSRGGYKLESALARFDLTPKGVEAIDLGASTGGFTDCLLQHGAQRVYAVDVGHGQLAWRLRNDQRVVVMERTNARYLTPRSFPSGFKGAGMGVADCSFISLTKVLPPLTPLLTPGAPIVALIKPQFEAGKKEVDKGKGVIRDEKIHQAVVAKLKAFVEDMTSVQWRGVIESPIKGPAGNTEFLAHLEKE